MFLYLFENFDNKVNREKSDYESKNREIGKFCKKNKIKNIIYILKENYDNGMKEKVKKD